MNKVQYKAWFVKGWDDAFKNPAHLYFHNEAYVAGFVAALDSLKKKEVERVANL